MLVYVSLGYLANLITSLIHYIQQSIKAYAKLILGDLVVYEIVFTNFITYSRFLSTMTNSYQRIHLKKLVKNVFL